jgi:intracellular sulfur oxidation DsrE/DsrF family protein
MYKLLIKYISLILLLFSQSHILYSQEKFKVVLHLNDTFKLEHLNKSVNNIRSELGDNVKINIVINGKAVLLMVKDNETSTEIITNLLQKKAEIGLCHNAIRNNNIKKNFLIKGLKILPNDGNVSIINFQKKGYLYIKM